MIERRTARRVPIRLLVQHQEAADDIFDIDYTVDLSRRGVFIKTLKEFAPGSTLHVQFAPKRDSRLVSVFCRVARLTPAGIGAEFVSLDAEAQQLIDSVVDVKDAASERRT